MFFLFLHLFQELLHSSRRFSTGVHRESMRISLEITVTEIARYHTPAWKPLKTHILCTVHVETHTYTKRYLRQHTVVTVKVSHTGWNTLPPDFQPTRWHTHTPTVLLPITGIYKSCKVHHWGSTWPIHAHMGAHTHTRLHTHTKANATQAWWEKW